MLLETLLRIRNKGVGKFDLTKRKKIINRNRTRKDTDKIISRQGHKTAIINILQSVQKVEESMRMVREPN